MTLQKAVALKACWKVSMQAIIFWAHRLKKISDNQYQYLYRQLSAKGYRKCEPLPLPAEEPSLVREILDVHRNAHGRTVPELGEFLGMPEATFRSDYWRNLASLRLVV